MRSSVASLILIRLQSFFPCLTLNCIVALFKMPESLIQEMNGMAGRGKKYLFRQKWCVKR